MRPRKARRDTAKTPFFLDIVPDGSLLAAHVPDPEAVTEEPPQEPQLVAVEDEACAAGPRKGKTVQVCQISTGAAIKDRNSSIFTSMYIIYNNMLVCMGDTSRSRCVTGQRDNTGALHGYLCRMP